MSDLAGYLDIVSALASTWPNRTFVWRGVSDAAWPLHSSLYRAARIWEGGRLIRERRGYAGGYSFRRYESLIFQEARRWGLQRSATDRLSALELLAALQHQGVPTRLLDFTHNAVIAPWFAAEDRYDANGRPIPEKDGRVFIAQANGREVPEAWARDPDIPWTTYRADAAPPSDIAAEIKGSEPEDWETDISVWTPPPIDPRMTRQQACFVFGGVPSTTGGWWGRAGAMHADHIRSCVSVPVRMYTPIYTRQLVAQGRPPAFPLAFTFKIPATGKSALRVELQQGFGYTHSMLYPDFPGFAAFGRSISRGINPGNTGIEDTADT